MELKEDICSLSREIAFKAEKKIVRAFNNEQESRKTIHGSLGQEVSKK